MNFSELFVRRPVMTVVLTASAILFGVMAYLNLPVNDLPAVDLVIPGFGGISGGNPGYHGEQRGHAAGTAVHADSRFGDGDLEQRHRTQQLRPAV